jgi:hypothetical protein
MSKQESLCTGSWITGLALALVVKPWTRLQRKKRIFGFPGIIAPAMTSTTITITSSTLSLTHAALKIKQPALSLRPLAEKASYSSVGGRKGEERGSRDKIFGSRFSGELRHRHR